jgi:hypothetical protein
MFKKNAWIAALFLAVAIVFTGCLDPLEEESTEGLVDVTLLDLGPELQKMPVGLIGTDAVFQDLFGDLPIAPAGSVNGQVILKIEVEGGKNVLDVTGTATWGAGVDLDLKKITLKAGDTIYIKGKLITGGNLFLNKNPGAGVAKINDWEFKTDGATYETTQTLTAGDLAAANGSNPPAIRVRANGESHFTIEQLKIVGKREAGSQPGPNPDTGYKVPENGEIKFDSALNMYYFYVDLNTVTKVTNPPTNFSSLGTPPEFTINSSNVKLTYSGSANDRPTVTFAFDDPEKVKAVYDSRAHVVVEWNVTSTASGGNYRFSIGNLEGKGSAWNAAGSLPNPLTSSFDGALGNAVQGDNPNTQGIVLQQMGAPRADELTVRSIKVYYDAPKVINAGAVITLPPSGYGNIAYQSIDTTYVSGKVIRWANASGNAAASFDYKGWDTEKKYPLFQASTTYTATIQITPKAGYLLDGWTNGMPLIVMGADTTATNIYGQNNYSFNSNNNTITVQIISGATAQSEWTLGDLDPTVTYSTTGNGFVIYDSAATSNLATINFQDAGCVIEKVNNGYNVTNRGSNDWAGLDIIISSLTPATKRYKITVVGVYVGLAGDNVQVQLGQGASPYSGLQWSGALDDTNKTFNLSQEIPEDWFVIGSGDSANRVVRVNTTAASGSNSAGMYNSFRVSRIIIEDLNLERIRIGALTGIGVTAPVLNAALPAASSVAGQPAGTTVTGIVWKKGADTVTGNFGASTAYTAEITIRAPNTHTFTGFSAGAANANLEVLGTDPAVATTFEVIRDGRSITIKATFPKTDDGTPITAGALSGITKPVINGAPSTSATGGSEYTLSAVTWSPTVASNFLGSTVYTATVTLTVTGTNTFTGLVGDFTVADATVTKEVSSDGRTCKISAAFPATDAPDLIAASNTITITAPVLFDTAPTANGTAAVSGTDITSAGAVTWTPAPVNGVFVGGVSYTASVTVSATAITKTLTGATAALFSAANGGTIGTVTPGGTLAQSTAVVTVIFPATAATKEIGSATIAIVAPVAGQGPQQVAISSTANVNAGGPITWKDSAGAAITGNFPTPTTGITAEFTVTTAQYYTFKDATITVTGGTVTPAAGSVNGATVAVKVTY